MKDDLISRRYLIEAFKDEFYSMYSDDFNYIIKWFENLPAADSSEFCDQLWQIAYEHGKAEARVIKLTEADKERLRKAMQNAEVTLLPAEPNHDGFLEFLFNVINPNEMEQYMAMYNSHPNCGARMEGSNG